jgi:hypothetical protein
MQKLSASLVVCLVLLVLAGNASAQKKEPQELFIIRENNLAGFMDKTGKVIIPPQFANVQDFSDGLALVAGNDFFGYIDKTGHPVINLNGLGLRTQGFPRPFSEGFAAFQLVNTNKWGYLDKTGKIAIEPQLEEAYDFSEGLARVKQYGKYTFIDKTGKVITDPVFDSAGDFSGGLARVAVGTRWGYIDKQGRYVWRSK